MKHLLITALSFLLLGSCYAQADDRQALLEAFRQLTGRYMSAGYISFDVAYKSADEKTPGAYYDSLKGSCKMNAGEYWYMLDSTEYIRNKEYSIVLFRQDKIMYLSRPSSLQQGASPLALMDSSFLSSPDFTGSIDQLKAETRITISFKPGHPYKKIELLINRKTGLIGRMTSIVEQKLLVDGPDQTEEQGPSYAVIEVAFSNYKTGSFGDEAFSSNKYFLKEDTRYSTTTAYQSYSIFLSTPNL